MARARSFRGERDDTYVPSQELDRLLAPTRPAPRVSVSSPPFQAPDVLDDARFYHPAGDLRPAMDVFGSPVAVQGVASVPIASPSGLPAARRVATMPQFRFADVKNALVCVRRRRRREVLFALGRQGGRGRRRRNVWSEVSC